MAATKDATWELVLKRNPVERLKQEKSPLGILGELPALIADGYERMAEEDERTRQFAEEMAAGRRKVVASLRAEADALLEGLAAPHTPALAGVSG